MIAGICVCSKTIPGCAGKSREMASKIPLFNEGRKYEFRRWAVKNGFEYTVSNYPIGQSPCPVSPYPGFFSNFDMDQGFFNDTFVIFSMEDTETGRKLR